MVDGQRVVMIVDDDEPVRKATRRLVKSFGFVVETFASAEDFLGSDRLDKTSCLILDVKMPGMSGIELQRHLIASDCRIPIVFVTGFADDRMHSEAMQAGAVGVLLKPFREDDLLDCLHLALKQNNLNGSNSVHHTPGIATET